MHTAGDPCIVEGTYLKHYFARFKFQQTAALHFYLSIKIRLLASAAHLELLLTLRKTDKLCVTLAEKNDLSSSFCHVLALVVRYGLKPAFSW
jgi:hypothetical protein